MPIVDLTKIHFAAEGKNHGDQQNLKCHAIDIGAAPDTSPGKGSDPVLRSVRSASGARGDLQPLCDQRTTCRCRFGTGLKIREDFLSFGGDSESCEQQSSGRTHYVLFHNCRGQKLLRKRPGV